MNDTVTSVPALSAGNTRVNGKAVSGFVLTSISCVLASCALPQGSSLGGDASAPMLSGDVVYNSIDPSLVDAETAPDVETGEFSGVRPKFGISTGVVYDDNINLDPTNPTSDVEFTVRPRLSFGIGDSDVMEETYVALDYQPTAHVFVENSDENAVDHDVLLHGQYRLGKLRAKGKGRFLSLSGANREVGARTEQKAVEAAIESAWEVTGKTAVGIRTGVRNEMFDEEQYADTSDKHIEAFAEYAITGKTTVGIGARYGQISTDNAPDQEYTQAFVQAQTRPAEKLSFTARAGVDRRDIGGATEVNPLLEASLNYKPREGTEIQVSPFSTLNPSTLNPGESYVRTGANVSVRQKLGKRFYAKVEGGYEQGTYASADANAAERKDDYWYIKPSVGYEFKEGMSAELYYRHSENSSSNAEFGYEANQVGAALNIQY